MDDHEYVQRGLPGRQAWSTASDGPRQSVGSDKATVIMVVVFIVVVVIVVVIVVVVVVAVPSCENEHDGEHHCGGEPHSFHVGGGRNARTTPKFVRAPPGHRL